MGLFSGFRAKFTKDSVAKNAKKDLDKNNVVCVGYRTCSEFDDPPRYQPQKTIEPIRKPSSTIKTIPPQPELKTNGNQNNHSSPVTATPETWMITNPNARKPNKIKPSPPNRIMKQEIPISENATSELQANRTSDRIYVVGKTSSFNPDLNSPDTDKEAEQQPKSILKQKPTIEIIEVSSDPITTNENSQYLVSGDSDDNKTLTNPTQSYLSKTKIVEINYDSSDNEENIATTTKSEQYLILDSSKDDNTSKIPSMNGFAQEQPVNYLSTRTQSTTQILTETESINTTVTQKNSSDSYYSGNYSYSQNTGKIGSTSSVAANIFFGGDEEPEVQRPRRFNMNGMRNDDESRSSAEC